MTATYALRKWCTTSLHTPPHTLHTHAPPPSYRLEAAGDGPDAYHKPGSSEADGEFEWLSPNERVRVSFSRSWPELLALAADYDLCLTGDTINVVAVVLMWCF